LFLIKFSVTFSHPQTGDCLKRGEKIELSVTTMKSSEGETVKPESDSFMKNATVQLTTEHNPYEHYNGEYGKEFNHYVKMGVNESDIQESIDKIVELEAKEELKHPQVLDTLDGYIIFDVNDNNLEPLKQPEPAIDHHPHGGHNHDESIAMVTVGCLILSMLVFLLAMVYIRRITRRVPASMIIDPEADLQKPYKLEPSKIVHEPLPRNTSLRSSVMPHDFMS
jgi:hypothetical protein